jgi:LuxR family maltose regulon positive regulatory protein
VRLRLADLRLRLGGAPHGVAPLLQFLLSRHAGDTDIAAVWLVGPAILHRLADTPWQGSLSGEQVATLARWARGATALRGAPVPQHAPAQAQTAVAVDGALSEREREVLARIAAGDSNKLIARAFDLSPHTVKRHVANILDKLDLRSRGQAAAWYRDHATA